MGLINSEYYRAIIRVHQEQKHELQVVVPSWSKDILVTVPKSHVPSVLLEDIRKDFFLIAWVNLDVRNPEDLKFRDWELAPEPADLSHLETPS